jgi:hypothetical protein
MCSQLPNCVCDAEDPRPSVEYLTERKRSIYDKLAEEGGGTWATYMMMDIEEAYGTPQPS